MKFGHTKHQDPPRASLEAVVVRIPGWRLLLALAGFTALSAGPAAASGEVATPTAQAVAAHAEFLAAAPPPPSSAAMCLVDTGMKLNPDTGPGVLYREALDPEQTADDTAEDLHGTRMAMIAAAPRNGWGTVGIWPRAKLVAINTLPAGGDSFPFGAYRNDLARCKDLADVYPIRVIVLALGAAAQPDAIQMMLLAGAVDQARAAGLNVVAAAGNGGGAVEWPAAYAPILAIGASGPSGGLCVFSARGPELDILAPGCPVEGAFADGAPALTYGTSSATAVVAGALAALRAYRPDLGPSEAEQLLLETATNGTLNVRAAFLAAGLQGVVAAGEQTPHAPPPSSSDVKVQTPPAPTGSAPAPGHTRPRRWPAPRLRWHRSDARLRVVLVRRPRHARAWIVVDHRGRRGTVRRVTRRVVVIRVARTGVLRIRARFLPSHGRRASRTVRVRVR